MRRIVLAVVGTRVLGCHGDRDRAAARIERAITKLNPAVVVSGGAEGVDSLAARVAEQMGYSIEADTLWLRCPAQDRWFGPGGYRERDLQIAEECTHLLHVSCILSPTYGSGWTADQAEKLGKPVVRTKPCFVNLRTGRASA